jgi:hypothetical protein
MMEPEMHSSFTQQVQAQYNDLAFTFVDLLVVLLLTSVSINLVLAFQLRRTILRIRNLLGSWFGTLDRDK